MEQDRMLFLVDEARKCLPFAYAPYSRFHVAAALLCGDGTVYTGCNVENASYPAGCCAERTAFFKAVSEGERHFTALAVVGGKDDTPQAEITPCGVCRQALYEFCGGDLIVLMAQDEAHFTRCTLAELLPASFGPKELV